MSEKACRQCGNYLVSPLGGGWCGRKATWQTNFETGARYRSDLECCATEREAGFFGRLFGRCGPSARYFREVTRAPALAEEG